MLESPKELLSSWALSLCVHADLSKQEPSCPSPVHPCSPSPAPHCLSPYIQTSICYIYITRVQLYRRIKAKQNHLIKETIEKISCLKPGFKNSWSGRLNPVSLRIYVWAATSIACYLAFIYSFTAMHIQNICESEGRIMASIQPLRKNKTQIY